MEVLTRLTRAPLRSKALLAAASGLLLVLALPKPDVYPLSWIALVPLLMVCSPDDAPRATFTVGYAAGLVLFGGTCYWIVTTMATYGGLSIGVSVAVFVLFVAVFALHTGLFAFLIRRHLVWFGEWGLLLAAPTWVGIELVQTHLIFGGFPWMLAGYGLAPYGGLLQMTSWSGIYGLSFVLVGVNSLIVFAIRTRTPIAGSVGAVVILSAVFLPVPHAEPSQDTLSVRLVQTNIDIDQSWREPDRERLMEELYALSIEGAGAPELVVWPETPAPFYLDPESEFTRYIQNIAGLLDAYVLAGHIGRSGEAPTNSAGIVSPSGELISRYDKMHLVPFGEYVPLKNLLFFAESLVRNVGDFVPGTDFTVTEMDGHRLATTICYEDVFPDLIRRFTEGGAEVIVNITNDGWFGRSSAPYQHLRMARVRAAENRRYLIRAANTGITAIIDPYGNVLARTELGTRTFLEGEAGYRSDLTLYVRFGDLFAYAVTVLLVLAMLGASIRASRSTPRGHRK